MLTLISVQDGYVSFENEDGDEVNLTVVGGPLRQVTYRSEIDLSYMWANAVADLRRINKGWYVKPPFDAFQRQVRLAVLPEEADDAEVVMCESCEDPQWADEAESTRDGHACSSCYEDNYFGCDDCGTIVHREDTYFVHDESVCNRCLDRYYSYCEECDTYYHEDYADDHRHGGCDCESPAQHFSMRHGETTVAADERFTATIPAGLISEEAMQQIAAIIRHHSYAVQNEANPEGVWEGDVYRAAIELRNKWWNFADEVTRMDPQWQTKDGNFTKRLSKLAHKSAGLKVPPALLTQVGNIGRDNSQGAEVQVEMTRNLNLGPEEFYHEDSCWWQSYSDSRCSLKQNGGIGMRTFDDAGRWPRITGRAWVQPLKVDDRGALQPTFDAVKADAYMVYNGYGDLSGYTAVRIVADMVGMSYRKVQFDMSPQYVNNGTGYLVASQDVIAKHEGGVRIYADIHSTLHHNETFAARDAALVSA